MQETVGITLTVSFDIDPIPVYETENGIIVVEKGEPYLLSDGVSLVAPIPVVLIENPTEADKARAVGITWAPDGGGGILL